MGDSECQQIQVHNKLQQIQTHVAEQTYIMFKEQSIRYKYLTNYIKNYVQNNITVSKARQTQRFQANRKYLVAKWIFYNKFTINKLTATIKKTEMHKTPCPETYM